MSENRTEVPSISYLQLKTRIPQGIKATVRVRTTEQMGRDNNALGDMTSLVQIGPISSKMYLNCVCVQQDETSLLFVTWKMVYHRILNIKLKYLDI